MEIQYKRSFSSARGRQYSVGEINTATGYAMELVDSRPRLQEGKLGIDERLVMLLGITPEEYALRESDVSKLNELAARLRKHVPADRLLGLRIVNLRGETLKRDIRIETQPSIDDGAFVAAARACLSGAAGPADKELIACARLQRRMREAGKTVDEGLKTEWLAARRTLGAKLAGLETVWIAGENGFGGSYPWIGFDGRLELFTLKARAESVCARMSESNGGASLWSIREMHGAELADYLRKCAGDGLGAVRVDNGFAAAELSIADMFDVTDAENASLRAMLLRELQYGLRRNLLKEAAAPEPNVRGALESMLSLRNFAWRELGNAKLYVLCAGKDDLACVALREQEGSKRMLAVFTQQMRALAFGEHITGDVRAVDLSFDEIVKRCFNCASLVIDPGTIGYKLPREMFDKVLELRDKPPLMVRIAPPKQEEERKPVISDMGELPDPDSAEGAKEKLEAEPENLQAEEGQQEQRDTPVKRKGLFKRLFGKRGT